MESWQVSAFQLCSFENTQRERTLPPSARPDQFKNVPGIPCLPLKSTILWEGKVAVAHSSELLGRFPVAVWPQASFGGCVHWLGSHLLHTAPLLRHWLIGTSMCPARPFRTAAVFYSGRGAENAPRPRGLQGPQAHELRPPAAYRNSKGRGKTSVFPAQSVSKPWPRNPCAMECLAFQQRWTNVHHACQPPSVFTPLVAAIAEGVRSLPATHKHLGPRPGFWAR